LLTRKLILIGVYISDTYLFTSCSKRASGVRLPETETRKCCTLRTILNNYFPQSDNVKKQSEPPTLYIAVEYEYILYESDPILQPSAGEISNTGLSKPSLCLVCLSTYICDFVQRIMN
jgi:hypothetical protein